MMMLKNDKELEKGEDRFCRLSDDVLIHILSCLNMRDAVRTCILSPRWKDLWKSVYCICIDFGKRGYEEDFLFVKQVLSGLKSENIQSFNLDAACDFDDFDVGELINQCVVYAVRHNVTKLKLSVTDNSGGCHRNFTIRLPQCIFPCKSLVNLTLNYGHFGLDLPESKVCFPNVKSLYINSCLCQNTDAVVENLVELLSSCPVLEDLTFESIEGGHRIGKTYGIVLPNIRRLHLKGNRVMRLDSCWPNRFVIQAPKLDYLCIEEEEVYYRFSVGGAPLLSKVILNSCCFYKKYASERAASNFDKDLMAAYAYVSDGEGQNAELAAYGYDSNIDTLTTQLLDGIKNTRSLSLSSGQPGFAYDGNISNMPIFPNLVHLELKIEYAFGWELLPHFLVNSPFLHSLCLEQDCTNQQLDRFGLFHLEGISDHFALFHLENMPFCLLKNLRKISFKDVEGEFHELEAIKYLLKFSRVLESFSIKTKGGRSSKVEKIKDLILRFFPKASQFCEIKFVEKL